MTTLILCVDPVKHSTSILLKAILRDQRYTILIQIVNKNVVLMEQILSEVIAVISNVVTVMPFPYQFSFGNLFFLEM